MGKIEMIMPKMGESIMEGTILKWLKKEGDSISEDESVLEVATDKVDTEIPCTSSGVLSKILVNEGDVVKVGKVIAIIDSDTVDLDTIDTDSKYDQFVDEIEKDINKIKEVINEPEPQNKKTNKTESNKFFSPLVLNIASRENISIENLEKIKGTGENDRVTKFDLLKFIEDSNDSIKSIDIKEETSEIILKEGEELIEPDRIRKIIAQRMIESKRISPHVTSFVEADVTNIFNERNKLKDKFLKINKTPLTFNPIFISCVTKALEEFPMMNISYINNKIIKKKYINIGIAVALNDDNLIVPVLKNTDKMSFMEIVKESNDLIFKARENKLKTEDLEGGTFTISNVGSFGNVMGTPIILQPQVGILAIGSIRKLPGVVETPTGDKIMVRNKIFLSHTYDHRIIDGAVGGKFAQKVAQNLEIFDLKSNISM
tara:strand:- start:703 stop:1992 length:1290 start_codon:yes stop_codon:yes gene_type:complete